MSLHLPPQPASDTNMKAEPEEPRTRARQDILSEMALALAKDAGCEQQFRQSQHWQGYKRAFESWAEAIWGWIDSKV